jgi:hypothetical protein
VAGKKNVQVLLNDIKMLPQDKQEEVVDFIAFLKSRFGTRKKQSVSTDRIRGQAKKNRPKKMNTPL